jgi:hypothetical protein
MSRDEGRVCIRSQIDDELDQWREDYARLEPLLVSREVLLPN